MTIQRVELPLGREAQAAVFRQARERVAQGFPLGLLFTGEDGCGRTHWLNWLRQESDNAGWVTLLAHCDERALDNPYQPFFTALGLTQDKNGEIINDRSVASVVDQIPLPDVISAVSNIPGVGAIVAFGLIGKTILDGHRRPLEADALLNRNFEFIRQTFVEVYKRKKTPIVLFLDDLERAPRTTFALIRHVLVRNAQVPLLVVATWQAQQPVPNDLVGLMAPHELPPLTAAEAERLIDRLERAELLHAAPDLAPAARPAPNAWLRSLRQKAPEPQAAVQSGPGVRLAPDLRRHLIEFSRGLPGLIVEGYKLLEDGAGANFLQAAAVDTNLMVRGIAERHLAHVPHEALPLLECAAQLGERFSIGALSAPRMQTYTGMSERRIVEIIAGLAEDGRVLHYDGEDGMQFSSSHLAGYLRGRVAAPIGRRDHLRLAEAGAEAGMAPSAIAHQYFAGGDFAQALEYALRAAEVQLRDAAYAEAAGSYRLALDALDGLGGASVTFRGQAVEAFDLLRSASFAAERAGDWPQAYAYLERALPLTGGDAHRAAGIQAQLGWLAHNQGRMQAALDYLSAARDAYAQAGDDAGVAKVRYYEGVLHIAHKAWALAGEALEAAATAAQRVPGAGAADLQALAYLELGNLHRQQRAWADAERVLLAGMALAERSGDAYALAQGYHYLGMVYGRQERPEAVAALEQARTIARERVKQPHLQAMIENTLAETLVRARRWDEAEDAFHTSERLKEQLGDAAGLAMTFGGLARLYHRQWRFDAAAGYYRKDLALLERDAEANVAFCQQIHNSLGEILRLAGQPDAAQAEFARGLELCAAIPDSLERKRSEGYSHLGFARLALDRADHATAEREWSLAEPLLRGTWMEPELERVQCWLRRAQGRLDDARAALGRCLAVIDTRGEDYEKLQAALERARLARDSRDRADLPPALARVREIAGRLRNETAVTIVECEFGAAQS